MSLIFLFLYHVTTVLSFYPYVPIYGPSEKATSTSTLKLRDNKYDIVNATQPKQSNSAAVDQDGNDLSYMAVVNLGSTGSQYYMLLDSTGSQSWIYGSDCTLQVCQSHNTFGSANSDSLTTSSSTFNVGYGTGNVSGILGTDNVTLAGLTVPLTFGIVSDASSDLLNYPMDGILSLGQASAGDATFMNSLSQQNLVPSKLWGVRLSRHVHNTNGNDGEIDFGSPNTDLYSGSLAYSTAIADSSFWEIGIDGAGVDGKAADIGSSRTAILDTGTSYIYMPPSDAQAIHSLISGSKQDGETFTIPCSTQSIVQISVSNVNYNISYQDIVGDTTDEGTTCGSKIISRETFGPNRWLVGDVFLKNVYTVFDYDQNRVGFGVQATTSSASATSSSTSSSMASGSTVAVSSNGSPANQSGSVPGAESSGSSSTTPAPTASTQSNGMRLVGDCCIPILTAFIVGLLSAI